MKRKGYWDLLLDVVANVCDAEDATTAKLNAYVNDSMHAANSTSVDVVAVPASNAISAATSSRHISTFPADHW